MVYDLQDFVQTLDNLGLIDIILPFLLVFTLVFAILEKAQVFGAHKKNINSVVSIIMGLLVIVPHVTGTYPAEWDVVDIINGALPIISLVVIVFVMFLLLMGVFGAQSRWGTGHVGTGIMVICLVAVVWAFGAAAGRLPGWDWLTSNLGEEILSFLIIIIVFGLVIAFITGGGEHGKKMDALGKFGESINSFFGGGGGGHH